MEDKVEVNKKSLMDILLIIVFILLIVFGGYLYTISKQVTELTGGEGNKVIVDNNVPSDNTPAVQKPIIVDNMKINDADHVIGKEGSDVEVILFTDIECPFCSSFHSTFHQAIDEYEGRVAFTIRHFPLERIHPNAKLAANAAECAAYQDNFLEYMDIAMKNKNDLSVEALKKYALDLGLDSSKFDGCLDNTEKSAKVQNDINSGLSAGVNGVPATFVNGELISGALPYAQLKALIEKYL